MVILQEREVRALVDSVIIAGAAEEVAKQKKENCLWKLRQFVAEEIWRRKDITTKVEFKGSLGVISLAHSASFSQKEEKVLPFIVNLKNLKSNLNEDIEEHITFNTAQMLMEEKEILIAFIKEKYSPKRSKAFVTHKKVIAKTFFYKMLSLCSSFADFQKLKESSGLYNASVRTTKKRKISASEIEKFFASEKKEANTPVCPKCNCPSISIVTAANLPFPFWKCSECNWSRGIQDPD